MHVAAVTGMSGSGKTTLVEALIRLYTGRGARVAAIKHTHHPLNLENRGDTARFLAAGATPVILARDGEVVVWTAANLPPLPVRLMRDGGVVNAAMIDELLEHARPFHSEQKAEGGWGEESKRGTPGSSSMGMTGGETLPADIVLVEGFKEYGGWPRIDLLHGAWHSAHEAAGMLDRIWHSS